MVEYAHIPFGPQSGGYASVFFGWTALYVVVTLMALYRRGDGLRRSGSATGGATPRVPEGFVPGALYWALLAAIGVLAWIVLYLV